MRIRFIYLAVLSIIVASVFTFFYEPKIFVNSSTPDLNTNADFVPGEIIVKYKDGKMLKNKEVNGQTLTTNSQPEGLKRELPFKKLTIENIRNGVQAQSENDKKANKKNTLDIIKKLKEDPNVEYAEPNYIVKSTAYISNDPQYLNGSMWGLNNTGQDGGTADIDINAPEAWNIAGNSGVKVAVLDTGVDYTHEDLSVNIDLINQSGAVTAGNINGYNFCATSDCLGIGNNNPMDDNGHGTHVAGTIAAVGQNGKGVIGVCPKCKIMPIKVLASNNYGTFASVTAGIYFAIDNGARVINMSLGAPGAYSAATHEAIALAKSKNIVVVASAGNCGDSSYALNGCDYQNQPEYPGNDENVIAVGSIDRNGNRSSFSTSGNYVSVVAPGGNIVSTCLGNQYCYESGTSMAAPHVAGVVGIAMGANVNLTNSCLFNILQTKSTTLNNGSNLIRSDAFANSYANCVVSSIRAMQIGGYYNAAFKNLADGSLSNQYLDSKGWYSPTVVAKNNNSISNSMITISGWVNIFYVGSDNKIYYKGRENNSKNWSGVYTIPNINTAKDIVAINYFNSFRVYWLGIDNNVYYQAFGQSGWTAPLQVISGGDIKTISAVVTGEWITFFYTKIDGTVYYRGTTNGSSWAGTVKISNASNTQNRVVPMIHLNTLVIFYKGQDENMYSQYFSGGWSSPRRENLESDMKDYDVVVDNDYIIIFYILPDNSLIYRGTNNGNWSNIYTIK